MSAPEAAATPRAPRGLDRAGRATWRALTEAYELDSHELALLRAVCRTIDRLERLAVAEAELGDDLLVEAKTGPAMKPILVEQRMQGQALGRLCASLRIPDDAGTGAGRNAYRTPRSLASVSAVR